MNKQDTSSVARHSCMHAHTHATGLLRRGAHRTSSSGRLSAAVWHRRCCTLVTKLSAPYRSSGAATSAAEGRKPVAAAASSWASSGSAIHLEASSSSSGSTSNAAAATTATQQRHTCGHDRRVRPSQPPCQLAGWLRPTARHDADAWSLCRHSQPPLPVWLCSVGLGG